MKQIIYPVAPLMCHQTLTEAGFHPRHEQDTHILLRSSVFIYNLCQHTLRWRLSIMTRVQLHPVNDVECDVVAAGAIGDAEETQAGPLASKVLPI